MTDRSGFWEDRPVLVTGATGLVGSWTVRRLLELGAEPVCLVRDHIPQSELVRSGLMDRVRAVTGDVVDAPILERVMGEYEVDTVLHLAAQTIVGVANRNPVSTFESNIKGTWSVLEAARRSPAVRAVILASSDKAYGEKEVQPYDESMPLEGRHPYDVSKSCSDLIGQAYAHTYRMPVAITRCGNFYGGGDLNWNRIVPGTIRSVVRGRRPVIRSDGTLVRDYFYVEDGAIAYTHLAERLHEDPERFRGRAYNFSNERSMTVLDLVRTILDAMESDLEPEVLGGALNEIREQRLDSRRAREELGWRPAFALEAGLERTIAWYRAFLEAEVT